MTPKQKYEERKAAKRQTDPEEIMEDLVIVFDRMATAMERIATALEPTNAEAIESPDAPDYLSTHYVEYLKLFTDEQLQFDLDTFRRGAFPDEGPRKIPFIIAEIERRRKL